MKVRSFSAIVCLLVSFVPASAVGMLQFSKQPVLDQANALSEKQEAYLNERVQKFMDQTSMEIKLVVVDDVSPYETASDYAEELYHEWKLGDKDKHNGLLLLIAEQIGSDSKDMKDYCRIMTGWGVITIIPDSVVIDDIKHGYMMPRLPSQPFLAFDNSLDRIFEDVSAWRKEHPEDTTVTGLDPSRIQTKGSPEVVLASTETESPVSGAAHTESDEGLPWGWIVGGGAVILVIAFMMANSGSDTYHGTGSYPSSSTGIARKSKKKPSGSRDGGDGGASIFGGGGCSTSCSGGGGGGCGGGGCGG